MAKDKDLEFVCPKAGKFGCVCKAFCLSCPRADEDCPVMPACFKDEDLSAYSIYAGPASK